MRSIERFYYVSVFLCNCFTTGNTSIVQHFSASPVFKCQVRVYFHMSGSILHCSVGLLIQGIIFHCHSRGGSRTSTRRGRQSLGGRQPNILAIFFEKPYEIKEILVRRGGHAPGAPPLNPPLHSKGIFM